MILFCIFYFCWIPLAVRMCLFAGETRTDGIRARKYKIIFKLFFYVVFGALLLLLFWWQSLPLIDSERL